MMTNISITVNFNHSLCTKNNIYMLIIWFYIFKLTGYFQDKDLVQR